jgi:signal transduction histidine kinase
VTWLTRSFVLGYPLFMDAPRETVVQDLVAGALEARDAQEAYQLLAEAARTALGGTRAMLLHRGDDGATVVCEVPRASAPPIDPETLSPALGPPGSVTVASINRHGSLLGVGLRPAWGLAILRSRKPWAEEDRAALSELAPYLGLVLEQGMLRAKVAEAADREAAAAAEHERFLSVISHELRNPLAPILMWTSTLRRLRAQDPEVQRAAQAISQAVSLARRLIEALLDLSRMDRGVIQLSIETVDLRDLVQTVIAGRRAAADEAKITLEDDLPPEGVPVRGDPARLAQIAGELLDNAIKFTPAGGRVSVALTRNGSHAQLTVRDTGPGLPADVVPKLFTPFVHGPNARGGLGLGLALAQRFLALQRGTIQATGASDGGAVLVVTLPVDRPRR